ncbi:TlpA family protein disulfide reductase [Alistipes sp. OttesenSCG-928-L06]|nr:TlpA family protein disulfide reductase [Alistipes sp. OttesenSCG-928-L06]
MRAFKYIAFLAAGLLAVSCISSDDEPNEEYVAVGDKLPVFQAKGPNEAVYNSADASGKVTLICLFNTTCPDCHRELPKVQYVWDQLAAHESFEVVCVGRERTLAEIATFWSGQGFTMPYYEDPQRAVYKLFATSVIPRLYLADRAGVVREMWVEETNLTPDQLLSVVKGYVETP